MNDSVRSAARVLDLLEYFAAASEGLALTTVSTVFGMPKSSTLALLRTLLVRGYLVRDERGLYSLNDAFRSRGFGWGGDLLARLVAVTKPAMDALCAEIGETVILGVLGDEGCIRFLAKSVAASVVRYDVDLSSVSPAYCTAIGRVLLSPLPRHRRDAILAAQPLEKVTQDTVVDLDRINVLIDGAAADGYCIVQEEFAVDGIGIAMPIFGPDGTALAALDVGCVASRFAAKRDNIIAAMRACIAGLPPQFSSQFSNHPSMQAATTEHSGDD
ncbi:MULTISPECIES: IclR family transcriptional regulator [unclassified Caballeronia]|uniref:IclR family transcriptional regulator n=1 Tax=unclassified Caballeronia TaxID=2646786 RepID=UPI0013EA7A9F|nr:MULTISPECIES: IclR family transcriptional regulator [unclassified Caballeronia]